MVEKKYQDKEILTIEDCPNNNFKTNAKSHRGIILGLLSKFRNDAKKGITYTPYELKFVFTEALEKYDELKKKTQVVELELVGWKGRDVVEFCDGFDNEFVLLEHRKDKETGEIEQITHKVSHENVNLLLKFIRKWRINDVHDCYYFAEVLGEPSWDEVWRKRTSVYFQKYYYPIKVLEKLGVIQYSGRGTIKRLK